MKILVVIFSILLFIIQDTVKGESQKSAAKSITPPPYYQGSEKTYYYYNPEVSGFLVDFIFRRINRFTCLKFAKQATKIEGKIGINFEISDENKVELSREVDTPTNVSLKKEDYKNGTVLRLYIGLALDMVTEVGRPNREKDVTVNMSNVDDKYKEYYQEKSQEETAYLKDTEFDFKSPMFFSSEFGSKENKPTYDVKLYKDYEYFSNGFKIFRHNDFKHFFYYYCLNVETETNTCKNGGYKPSTEEFKLNCKCPDYFTGSNCEKILPNYKDCKDKQQDFTAEKDTKNYELNITSGTCYFKISSKNKKNVSITIEKLELNNPECLTYESNLEVLVRNDKGAAGINLCQDKKESTKLPSLSKEVIIVLNSQKKAANLKFSYQDAPEQGSENS
uniref:Astacin domain-containing protein n=1 Tax=Strongyloides venezuelensis TaxID=75913 RepID=A0A0K0F1L1_STRVS